MTREELYALKSVDIKSAKLDDLVDIQNIKVDSSKSVEERIVDFIVRSRYSPDRRIRRSERFGKEKRDKD